jgi:PAS domain S-box-containing protein
VFDNITERMQTQKELGRLRLAVDASNEVIFMTDLEGVITSVNPAFTRLYGYAAAEVVGNATPRILKSGTMPQEAYESFWNSILNKRVVTGEMVNKTRDGRLLTIESSANPILNEQGESIGFLAIQRDLTEEKQLQAQFLQAQKMESVGQLASGIAHDFNNLLTVINGMSELVLAQVSQDNLVHADVQEILHSGERAAMLTRQLLAFSRQQILEPRVMNFNTVVAGMEGLLRRLLGEDIDLVVVPTPGVGHVKADPGQIEQVITNLAVNARDAMPQGGQLTIETQNVTIDKDYARQIGVTMPPGSYVLLAVSDSGGGMDEAIRVRIFEPFFTTKGPSRGTGLGLSTVYGIVKQSHGFIGVYSEVGQGTSFKIYLPQVTEAAGTDRPGPTVVSSSGTETILLVEDNVGLLKLATRFLEPAGYTVLGAGTGEEALLVLARHAAPVHLLLTDVVMPGMSGRHLAERLAQTHPGMKVLYMSGYTSDTVVRHGVLEEKVSFINKPFNAAALLQKVREVLDSTDAGNSG